MITIDRPKKEAKMWNEDRESWDITGSGKFHLTVEYAGRIWESKSISKDKCREAVQSKITQAIELGIIKEEGI